jgi:hypothetical protein
MLRKSRLVALGSITLGAALAAVAVGAVLASGALAVVGGPVWVVKGTEMASEASKETLKSEGGQYTLTGTTNVVCEKAMGTGEIIGGNPGRGLSTITFEKCHEKNALNCLAASAGFEDSIQSGAKSVLVYPHERQETEPEALDALTPNTSGSTESLFVEFTFKNASGSTECGVLNGIKADVKATGSLISDPSQVNKQCGLLAQLGKLVGGIFALAVALEENTIGALNAPATVIKEATIWEPTKKTFGLITCKLEAFGEATEEGVSEVSLVSNNTFGWNK